MVIRNALDGDLMNVAALHVSNQRTTYRGLLSDEYLDRLTVESRAEKWREFLHHEGNELFAAWEGSRFLGFAACEADAEFPGCMYLDSLHVAPEARGLGVGTALIRTAARYAAEHGCDAMSVCIVRGNETARRLYLELGAVHERFFIDSFEGTTSRSEKLRWTDLCALLSQQ